MSAVPLLQVSDLALEFGGVQAIAELSLRVHAGEVLAVIGPNGAGKTSLLNVVTRVFDATRGQVRFGARTCWPCRDIAYPAWGLRALSRILSCLRPPRCSTT